MDNWCHSFFSVPLLIGNIFQQLYHVVVSSACLFGQLWGDEPLFFCYGTGRLIEIILLFGYCRYGIKREEKR